MTKLDERNIWIRLLRTPDQTVTNGGILELRKDGQMLRRENSGEQDQKIRRDEG